MMIIRYSSPNQLDITGPVTGWTAWKGQLLDMLAQDKESIMLDADDTAVAAPYNECLSGLRVRLSDSKIRFHVDSSILILDGDKKHITNFMDNMPDFVDEDEAARGYHIHYDKIGYETYFEDDSLDIVLTSAPEVEPNPKDRYRA